MPRFKYLLILIGILLATPAAAADFSFIFPSQNINVGDEFNATIMFNPGGEEINALEGKIIFPADKIKVSKIKTGSSLINIWVTPPQSYPGVSSIPFSGITPGGFKTPGEVFTVTFLALNPGTANLAVQEGQALLNDGLGTPAKLTAKTYSFQIHLPVAPAKPVIEQPVDREKPEPFTPMIVQNQELYNGRFTLIFAAADKNSGIDHYEISEKRIYRLGPLAIELGSSGRFVSPYLLHDQKRLSVITVKAVDGAGNEETVTLPPLRPLYWYENFLIWGIILLVLVVLTCFRIFYVQRQRQK